MVICICDVQTGEELRIRYLDVHPEQRVLKPHLARFFADWECSSAGQHGAVLSEH
ncbi:hypothetical protein P3W85_43375 [Cupriavidus basilensis]|uniref:Uncharacterized protein n=1 Tax=Cupriavidus basilensis TaxID=68895 RepID=A0ABT6B4B8_9BURK|nr:hypothetical protein [Cupriavidus basilensis]MDF3839732.1 hypothetical protein [Cupriavidus basilensis]